MKILHLSTTDGDGGAARAAFRLHSGLIREGVESQMMVRKKMSGSVSVLQYKYPKGIKKIAYKFYKSNIDNDFGRYSQSRPAGLESFSDDRSSLKYGFYDQLPDADIYHLHWISGFVDLPSFFRNTRSPIVWTLHDMFPFTGGCHYNGDCEKFNSHCNQCPQLGSSSEKDLSYKIWERKNRFISAFKNRLIIRADSHWLAGEAKKSALFKDLDIETIHYGIETDEFIPLDKTACRQALNIPVNSRVIVFGAPGIDNARKGFRELTAAINSISGIHSNLFLLSFGSGNLPSHAGIPSLNLGYVSNNHLLSLIYNCADVFVIPSLQEAFGQTALEAMSCGIPVAGFNAGGIPDMIENGITGYLAETGNVTALAQVINNILTLDDIEYKLMSQKCKEKVLSIFTLVQQAQKYTHIYRELLKL